MPSGRHLDGSVEMLPESSGRVNVEPRPGSRIPLARRRACANVAAMDLTPPPGLEVVFLAAVLVWAVSLTTEGRLRAPLLWATGTLAGSLAVCLALYLGLGLSIAVWREYPHEAAIAAFVGLGLLAVAGVRLLHHPPDEDEGEDDDGGERRPRPPRPRDPSPAGPVVPPPSWREFDEARAGWERTPTGTR